MIIIITIRIKIRTYNNKKISKVKMCSRLKLHVGYIYTKVLVKCCCPTTIICYMYHQLHVVIVKNLSLILITDNSVFIRCGWCLTSLCPYLCLIFALKKQINFSPFFFLFYQAGPNRFSAMS